MNAYQVVFVAVSAVLAISHLGSADSTADSEGQARNMGDYYYPSDPYSSYPASSGISAKQDFFVSDPADSVR